MESIHCIRIMIKFFIMLGLAEPMMIRSPIPNHRRNRVTYSLTSLLDIVPTLLDWFNIPYADQTPSDTNEVSPPPLTGKSLLPLLVQGKSKLSIITVKATLNIIVLCTCVCRTSRKQHGCLRQSNTS